MGWINKHFGWQSESVPPIDLESSDYELFMRPQGDSSKDATIKYELFEKHILGRYYVELVVDDRQQVVDMWRRQLGLTCVQVDYGDF